jgi:hypothetical protein
MKSLTQKLIWITALMLLPLGAVFAQDAPASEPESETALELPSNHLLSGFTYEAQGWNNCGPATLTMALTFFGYEDNQQRAARWLKPNGEDKNVSPWQMVDYVNTQVPELPVYATKRYGGSLETLKLLVSNSFPVIIELGYDPARAAQGWMGHYLLVIGYDDDRNVFITHDSYDGASLAYSYDHILEFWQHFNYIYMVLYQDYREAELLELLGDDADETQNYINAFEIARAEAIENPTDAFAWFNMGSMLVELEMYDRAEIAFDEARNHGLPWRMLWYQFGPYEAYNAVGRYQDTIELATRTRNDGGGHYVEETFYYAGIAREGLGETQRAIENYRAVLNFNPNFTPARERLDALTGN